MNPSIRDKTEPLVSYPDRLERVCQFSIYPYLCEIFGFKDRNEFREVGSNSFRRWLLRVYIVRLRYITICVVIRYPLDFQNFGRAG